MIEDMDLQADERKALDALRALIGEVIRLSQEYHDSAKLVHGDDIGAEREPHCWTAGLLEMLECWFGEFRLLQRAAIVQDRMAPPMVSMTSFSPTGGHRHIASCEGATSSSLHMACTLRSRSSAP